MNSRLGFYNTRTRKAVKTPKLRPAALAWFGAPALVGVALAMGDMVALGPVETVVRGMTLDDEVTPTIAVRFGASTWGEYSNDG